MKTALNVLLTFLFLQAACTNKTKEPTVSQSSGSSSSAPSGQDAAHRNQALVRFAQAIPNDDRMDLWFGETRAFPSVTYKQVTSYVELPADRRAFTLQLTAETQGNPVATNRESLSPGGRYTIVAMRKDNGEYTLMPLNDDLSAPTPGKTKVRVIHAAAGVGKLDIVGPGEKIFSGIDSDSFTSYKKIRPAQGTLEIRKSVDVLQVPNIDLQPDKLYTPLIVGGAGRPLEAVPVIDLLTRTGSGNRPIIRWSNGTTNAA